MLNNKAIDQAIIDGNRRILRGDAELLLKACEATQAKNVVEIGSFDGGSTIILGSWAKLNNARLYCCEPYPTGRWEANIDKYKLAEVVELCRVPSPGAAYLFKDHEMFDVLFIDGDHRTTHTIADFIAFAPLLKVGGIWVQHDWCGRASKQYGGRSVADMIRKAIDAILADYGDCFEEFGRSEGSDRGAIAYKKIKNMTVNIR